MNSLTKYDVLVYLSNGNVEIGELIRQLKQNAIFKARERKIRLLLAELRKDGFISKNKPVIALTSKATDTLAFLLWLKKDGIDYNIPFKKGYGRLFQKIFEKGETYLVDKSMFSKPTTLKIARDMKSINFIKALKRKPLTVKARVIDRTTLFANIFGYNFSAFQKNIKHTRIEKDSPKLREHLIRLHVYSTTVTEGNTASEKDVERVLNNLDSKLSPKEVMEIVNAKKAVDELYRVYKTEDMSLEMIKKLHRILMTNLVEKPGEISYTRKRIIGSVTKLPDSKTEIDAELEAMFNFYGKYKGRIEPQILASLVHFLFVSIHPFIDGNGRVARLIHSFVLMKAGLPLFAFDPNYRNIYFDLLDKGRAEGVEEFVQFCIDKHKELIERL